MKCVLTFWFEFNGSTTFSDSILFLTHAGVEESKLSVPTWVLNVVANPFFYSGSGFGEIALGRCVFATGQVNATEEKRFRGPTRPRETVHRKIGHNLFRDRIIPLHHGQVPAGGRYQSIGIKTRGDVLQNLSASSRIAVSKHLEVSKADLGLSRIGCDFKGAVVRSGGTGPITHHQVIVGCHYHGSLITRIEVL